LNAKTKDKKRKVQPFCVWLMRLAKFQGTPRRTQMPWVLWQHEKHGAALRALYRQKYKVDADEEEQEEGAHVDEGDEGEGEGEGGKDRSNGEGEGEGEGDGEGEGEGEGDGEGEKSEGEEDDEGEAEEEGGSLKGRSATLVRKYVLAKDYLAGLSREERAEVEKLREHAYLERLAAHERMAQGQVACSPEELAE
jgi:cobalamin biosynthesis protein CobT